MTCRCGSPNTHRLRITTHSLRGVATKIERGCARCTDRLAFDLLAEGHTTVEAERLGGKE